MSDPKMLPAPVGDGMAPQALVDLLRTRRPVTCADRWPTGWPPRPAMADRRCGKCGKALTYYGPLPGDGSEGMLVMACWSCRMAGVWIPNAARSSR